MTRKRKGKARGVPVVDPADLEGLDAALQDDGGDGYNPADNGARCYTEAIAAIRMEGVKAGRFLPNPDKPDEIKASPIVTAARRFGSGPDAVTLYCGDCTKIVPLLAEQGTRQGWIDACVTDPPYELGFMGKGWDSSGVAADWRTWGGVRIALKPGAHLVAFAGSRTYHRIATAIDDAGFEIRDQLARFFAEVPRVREFIDTLTEEQAGAFVRMIEERGMGGMLEWIYGSGFPKSLDVSKAIDKAAGMERPVVGSKQAGMGSGKTFGMLQQDGFNAGAAKHVAVTAAASAASAAWEGWGTALKPGHEPVCFARKPLSEGTVAANVLRWGTGAINVDATRVQGEDLGMREVKASENRGTALSGSVDGSLRQAWTYDGTDGRWPANVLHDGSVEVLEAFPSAARDATRFFYAAKADKGEREFGLAGSAAVSKRADPGAGDGSRTGSHRANVHPTVKPVDLMRWLIRLVTPPGGTVIDPFMGSGSTGIAAVREGCGFIGCEQSMEYFEIACRRIEAAIAERDDGPPDLVREITKATRRMRGGGQGNLF